MSATLRPTRTVETEPNAALLDHMLERFEQAVERRISPAVQPMELRSFEELERWAERAARSNMVPKSYQGKPDDIIIAVQFGSELGLRPMQALANIATINGRPCVWGDAILALCKTHPAYVSTEETIVGEGDARVARCVMVRRGEPPVVRTFSVADAKTAKLWAKKGFNGQDTPWITHPDRMLQMRARGFAARDAFPDKLRGLISAEEAQDYSLDAAGIAPTMSAAPAPAMTANTTATASALGDEIPALRKPTVTEWLDVLEADFTAAGDDSDAVDLILARPEVQRAQDTLKNGARTRLNAMIAAAMARSQPSEGDDDFPGTVTPREAAA